MSLSLAQITDNIKSEIKIDSEGRGFVSIRGVARLAGINHAVLIKAFSTGDSKHSKLTQTLIDKGFNLDTWTQTGVPDLALASILEYYALDAGRWCKQEAKLTYRAFATIGVRDWCQKLVGYQQPEPIPEKPKLPELPPEPNRDGLIMGIDYPDPEILKFLFNNFMTALMNENHAAIKEATEAKHQYVKQFSKNTREQKLLTESNQGTRSFEKFKVWQMLQCLSEPLPFDINHQFYKNGWVKKAYKSDRQYLKPDDIKRIFKDAENEGIGRFDPEINCFVPIHLMNNVILFNRALDGDLEQSS